MQLLRFFSLIGNTSFLLKIGMKSVTVFSNEYIENDARILYFIIKDLCGKCNRKIECFPRQEKPPDPVRRFDSYYFLRGEIESGFSSIQDLYMEIMFKVCRISETIG